MRAVKRVAWCGVALGLLLASPSRVQASTLTMINGNSEVDICISGCPLEQAGIYNWSVDGTNYLFQEWFYYTVVGSGVPYSAGPGAVDSLSAPYNVSLSNPGVGPSTASITYGTPTSPITAVLTYTLTGGGAGSNTSTLHESVTLTNNSPDNYVNINLFGYSDFDMCGLASHDDASISNGVATQVGDPSNSNCGPVAIMSQVYANTPPKHVEANVFPATLTNLLFFGNDLNDNPSVTNVDATTAFEWSPYAAAFGWENGNLYSTTDPISITKIIAPAVPEPASMLLLGTGLIAIAQTARRRLAARA
jgi:hypothetical protein